MKTVADPDSGEMVLRIRPLPRVLTAIGDLATAAREESL